MYTHVYTSIHMYTHRLRCMTCMWIEMHCKQMYTYTHPYVYMLYM